MSNPKETPFFITDEYDRGIDYYWSKYFGDWSGENAKGESNPALLHRPWVAERVKRYFPGAKLIASLRNPVDRAYSMWSWRTLPGTERRSFEEVISEDSRRINQGEVGAYLDVGYYAVELKRYLSLFQQSNFKIIFFEDFQQDPRSIVQDIFKFIGVDPDVPLQLEVPYNVATPLAVRPLVSLARKSHLRDILPASWKARFRVASTGIFGNPPKMNPKTRRWLIDHYYQHNRELEKIVDRDLSWWDH